MTRQFTSGVNAIAAEHDNRHKLPPEPLARESQAYVWELPEEGIAGVVYTWVNGEGKAGYAVTFFGPGVGEEPIVEGNDGVDVPDDMDFYNWEVDSLKLSITDLMQSARITFKSDTIDLDYTFTASGPAYAYSSHRDGCPQWIASDRFEQHGSQSGRVVLNGREIALRGYAQRDHSWGTRDWGINQHWKWLHAQAGPETGVHFWKLDSLGNTHLRGFVDKQGHVSQVTDVDVEFSTNEELQLQTITATVTDAAGRITRVEGSAYAWFLLPPHPEISLFESPLHTHIDGQPGNGWCELLWPNSLLNYRKQQQEAN